jgi:hypothetical protein
MSYAGSTHFTTEDVMKRFTKPRSIACALAVSLAIVVPTTTRAAGPPPTNVNVLNTPLPVTNAPVTPVQFSLGSGDLAGFYGTSYHVPTGQRLVIEHVSGYCHGDTDSSRVPVPELVTTVGGIEAFHSFVLAPAGDTPVLPSGVQHNYTFAQST